MTQALLSLRELSRVYRTDMVETTALDAIDLDIFQGEFVAIMGPSGCGKSTLLNMIGMLDSPSSGSYRFGDTEIAGLPEPRLAGIRKTHLGFIFQSFNLIDELSVAENIELALLYHAMPAAERKAKVEAVMDRVGIAHRARHRPSQLSGGQQQRVAVARALVSEPRLILADEPTGNLDTSHGEEVMKMLQTLNAEGSTIVMVTHSPAHADYASRVVHMLDGRILQERRRAA
ncbi:MULTISPECIES: ABC transporter ATP-binding protein [Sphingobium]|jgi:putative ABC transport system ATP-binding protein|uniref:ABC transporter domain-containing protein n=3 Tax=Sphingobium yanoikuyae TaxID=13690 RepID=K9DDQ9_SPHYA|nr:MULTISPECIES: ABC transporter ATP-binding protein [Sphingobium]PZU69185.1 MAG: ABC transporter ATP-binding protein [Sphingobium sp.]RSU74579.1 ABC transporter ATP-binding protein [Sphingomonas sp. S-NIH.Pt3_0716]ATI83343.1 ABC transporter ATP-binding protein [Sphingobium yanoikuyae]ATP21662.1 phosphonate ABC transporter ATP-binding protein [Sphingobium yanoikuyae]AYO78124.1 ABC transporter ATP-binding protein [Sphingobium yanoikuyae]